MKSGKSLFKLSRSQWISVAVLASSLGLAVAVTVPNAFTAGSLISATAMNDNFTALVNAVTTAEGQIVALTTNNAASGTVELTGTASTPGTITQVTSFTVAYPGPGTLLVTVSGGWWLDLDAPGITSVYGFGSLYLCDATATAAGCQVKNIDFVDPDNASPLNATHTFILTRVVPVAGAGSTTFYVNGLVNQVSVLHLYGTTNATVIYTPGALSVTNP